MKVLIRVLLTESFSSQRCYICFWVSVRKPTPQTTPWTCESCCGMKHQTCRHVLLRTCHWTWRLMDFSMKLTPGYGLSMLPQHMSQNSCLCDLKMRNNQVNALCFMQFSFNSILDQVALILVWSDDIEGVCFFKIMHHFFFLFPTQSHYWFLFFSRYNVEPPFFML